MHFRRYRSFANFQSKSLSVISKLVAYIESALRPFSLSVSVFKLDEQQRSVEAIQSDNSSPTGQGLANSIYLGENYPTEVPSQQQDSYKSRSCTLYMSDIHSFI